MAVRARTRRGFSLVDVAIAFILIAIFFLIGARFVMALTDASETSLERAHARDQVNLAQQTIDSDFNQVRTCEPTQVGAEFQQINDPAGLGAATIAMYVDVNLDGDADLVAYKVAPDGMLQRAVVLGTGDCSSLGTSSATFEDLIGPIRNGSDAVALFQPIIAGDASSYAGDCQGQNADNCLFDAIRVHFIIDGDKAGPVEWDKSYSTDPNRSRL